MALVRIQEASSSTHRYSYHVFLSFRGDDTRKTFTDHLFKALIQAGIRTFRDDDEIERGKMIKLELDYGIKHSRIAIVVFSKNYASSKWCLDELAMILECWRTSKLGVLPIFYDVDPTHVRNQTGCLVEAFTNYEDQLKAENNHEKKNEWMVKIETWKKALKDAASLTGKVLKNEADGHEATFINNIVKDVESKLSRRVFDVEPYIVGVDYHVNKLNSWMQDGSNDVKTLIIYGLPGIGKTTIAKTLYNLYFDMFEGSSFLENIRDASKQHSGLVRLQRKLLSDILNVKKDKIYGSREGIAWIKDALCCKRIFLVLDDVDKLDELDKILGMRDWLFPGSRIIITTTRYQNILRPHEVCTMYEVRGLNYAESLRLFCWNAFGFGQDHPIEGYVELSRRVVQECEGIPIALEILGRSLLRKSLNAWESVLKKLQETPHNEIHSKLKISYDSLEDDNVKNLFLDIVCFFVGENKDYATTILDHCGYFTAHELECLVDRGLLHIDEMNGKGTSRLMMHQLLQKMGREIIRLESPEEPGKRSRLWCHRDVLEVLREKVGTQSVKGLTLNFNGLKQENPAKTSLGETPSLMIRWVGLLSRLSINSSPIESFSTSNEEDVNADAFSGMKRLKLLQLNYAQVYGDYENFPKKLMWLCWHGFPLACIPINFYLENLVILDMRYSSLELVWSGAKRLGQLKILNLSHSQSLVSSPDFSRVPNLERLILIHCVSLVEIHESIGNLEKLVFWNLEGCKNLRNLPQSIDMLKSLECLILNGCSKLDELPEMTNMEALTVFQADGTNLFLCEEAKSHNALMWPWLPKPPRQRFSLAYLPRCLNKLRLQGCGLSDESFLMDFSCLPLLEELNLDDNLICSIPESITDLKMLKKFSVRRCKMLQYLPTLSSNLESFYGDYCKFSHISVNVEQCDVSLRYCEKLVEVEGVFKLEPIQNYDVAMINNLGLFDMDQVEGAEVKLESGLTYEYRNGPIQGLYERGIFSTFLPVSKISAWFDIRNKGREITFTVHCPPRHEIRGFSIALLFDYCDGICEPIKPIINIKHKDRNFRYFPTFYPAKDFGKELLWLSHWNFGNQLERGDEVYVLAEMCFYEGGKEVGDDFVKEIGVKLVHCEHEEGAQSKTGQVIQPLLIKWSNPTMDKYYFYDYQTLHRLTMETMEKDPDDRYLVQW